MQLGPGADGFLSADFLKLQETFTFVGVEQREAESSKDSGGGLVANAHFRKNAINLRLFERPSCQSIDCFRSISLCLKLSKKCTAKLYASADDGPAFDSGHTDQHTFFALALNDIPIPPARAVR